MGLKNLGADETLLELLQSKVPEGISVAFQRNVSLRMATFTWERLSDNMIAVLDVGLEEFRKIDYPDLFAEAATDEVMKVFNSTPYEVPAND